MNLTWIIDDYRCTFIEEDGEDKLRVGMAYEDSVEDGEEVQRKDAEALMRFFSHAVQDEQLLRLITQPDAHENDEDVEEAFRDYAYEHRLDCWLDDLIVTTDCSGCNKELEVHGLYAFRDGQLDSGQYLCPKCLKALRGM